MLGKLSNPFGGILSKMLAPRGDLLDPLRQSALGGFSGVTSDDLRPDARISSGGTTSALRGTPGPANGAPKPVASGDRPRSTTPDQWRAAIANMESGGKADIIGPRHPKLGRALGKYQVMEANVPAWTKKAIGRAVSADEFLANEGIQDAVFDKVFGDYANKYGPYGAAEAWFAGEGGIGKNRKDSLGTSTSKYAKMFENELRKGGAMPSKYQPDALGGQMADTRRGEPVTPYSGQTQLAATLPDQMLPPGKQKLPGSGGQRQTAGGSFQMEQASGMTPEEIQHPVAKAVQAYRVNRTTRLLRGLSPAATIAALTAIGQDVRLRGEEQRAQETQQNARD